MKRRFAIVIEQAGGNYSAYSPDVPGCITVGDTIEETKQNMIEALELHLEGMSEQGQPLPNATSVVDHVDAEIPVPVVLDR